MKRLCQLTIMNFNLEFWVFMGGGGEREREIEREKEREGLHRGRGKVFSNLLNLKNTKPSKKMGQMT